MKDDDTCVMCGHSRVFHDVATGSGRLPAGTAYCDDRHADPCSCTGFAESYRLHWFKLYETEDDGSKRLRGRDFSMPWKGHGWPKVIQTTEPDDKDRSRALTIVTYERREEWLDGRPYRTYYVRRG